MSEYGNVTLGEAATYDKERVKMALQGKLMVGEDENGFVFAYSPREECEAYILSVIDSWYFEAKRLADSGRAMERVMKAHRFKLPMREYMEAMAEEGRRFNEDYVYEHELAEILEDADEAMG